MTENGITIYGRLEKWVMTIVGTLLVAGVIATIVMAIKVGQIQADMVWIKDFMVRAEVKIDVNDRRLDDLERATRSR